MPLHRDTGDPTRLVRAASGVMRRASHAFRCEALAPMICTSTFARAQVLILGRAPRTVAFGASGICHLKMKMFTPIGGRKDFLVANKKHRA